MITYFWNNSKTNTYTIQKESSGGVLQKQVFLKFSRNSRENICARVSFLKILQATKRPNKRDSRTDVFSLIFQSFLEQFFRNSF